MGKAIANLVLEPLKFLFILGVLTVVFIDTATAGSLIVTLLNAMGDVIGIIIHGIHGFVTHLKGAPGGAPAPVCPPGGTPGVTPGC